MTASEKAGMTWAVMRAWTRPNLAAQSVAGRLSRCSSTKTRKARIAGSLRSEEHTSELQSLMRNSYAVFCLKKKITKNITNTQHSTRRHKLSRFNNKEKV